MEISVKEQNSYFREINENFKSQQIDYEAKIEKTVVN